jgi:hypothetical protein
MGLTVATAEKPINPRNDPGKNLKVSKERN